MIKEFKIYAKSKEAPRLQLMTQSRNARTFLVFPINLIPARLRSLIICQSQVKLDYNQRESHREWPRSNGTRSFKEIMMNSKMKKRRRRTNLQNNANKWRLNLCNKLLHKKIRKWQPKMLIVNFISSNFNKLKPNWLKMNLSVANTSKRCVPRLMLVISSNKSVRNALMTSCIRSKLRLRSAARWKNL